MTYVIAEIGVNHNGDLNLAKKMILAAKRSGVNAVKFQSFLSEEVVIKKLELAPYQRKNLKKNSSMIKMISKYQLSFDEQKKLFIFCKKNRIDFLSSPFDLISAKFLVEELKLKTIKIPSGEITNYPLLKYLSSFSIKIILSTGMATIIDIKLAINILCKKNKIKKENITVLHCTTSYPTNIEEVNLNAMLYLKKVLKMHVGYSDHTKSNLTALVATSLGASIIEKHLTLNKFLSGPDHKPSILPKEFKDLVVNIKKIEVILGNPKKKVTKSEKENITFARKSIVANANINKGDFFSENNLTTKRPSLGLSPMLWNKIIGKKSKFYFSKDEYIKL
jgi:N,N'-diacetyllegionaminate synthase